MGKSKGKTIVLLAGIAVLAVAVVTGLYWKPIATQIQLFRLRRNPDSLFQVIQAEEGSPNHLAVTKYLRTQAGKQHLYEAFLDAVSVEAPRMGRGDPQMEKILRLESVGEATFGLVLDSYFIAYTTENGAGGSTTRLKDTDNHKFFRSTKRFLPLLFGHRFTSEQLPDHQFTFVPADEACRQVGFYGGFHAGRIGRLVSGAEQRTAELPEGITAQDMEIMKTGVALLIGPIAANERTEEQESEIDKATRERDRQR